MGLQCSGEHALYFAGDNRLISRARFTVIALVILATLAGLMASM
jgi:hypothetical protein